MTYLKYIRIILALAVLILIVSMFIGIPILTPHHALIDFITYLQFIPSVLKFTLIASSIGFIIIIFITFLFGRVYCSIVCPYGILQDAILRLVKKFKRKYIFRYTPAKNVLRYTILLVTIISLLWGTTGLLTWLDPYSNFGKIASSIVRPIVVGINDSIALVFERFNMYAIAPVGFKNMSIIALAFSVILLTITTILIYKNGRLFCNTLCPLGSFLSLISRFSLFQIKINNQQCTQCGKCSTQCKSECIDIKKYRVDFDRCIGCYNCFSSCKTNSIKFAYILKTNEKKVEKQMKKNHTRASRRNFLYQLVGGIIGYSIINRINARAQENYTLKESTIPIQKNNPVLPPGAKSLNNFLSHCTACHLCVSQCPTHVLKPSFLEYGYAGMLMPFMNYNDSFCNYECTTCSNVCPTGALLPLTTEEKKTTQIGKVIFVKENCIVYLEETSCGACAEHCPTAAVHMVPYKGSIRIPTTNIQTCIGCGACEYACPAQPYKAIYIDGNVTHEVAQLPLQQEIQDNTINEFPF